MTYDEEQLELPYPVGDLILDPVLTDEAIDKIGYKNLCIFDGCETNI